MGDFFTWGPVVTDSSYYRETRLTSSPVADVTVLQPLETLRQLKRLHIPIIVGNNADEGTMFVFSAFPARMAKVVFQAYIISFFRAAAPGVLRLYTKLVKKVDDSPYPDYRIPLSTIIGDYLFRCPNKLFASLLAQPPISTPVFLYEFALPTRVQGFPSCDGLSCHTVEIPYVFNLVDMVVADNVWKPSEIDVGSALAETLGDGDVDSDDNVFRSSSPDAENASHKKTSGSYQYDQGRVNSIASNQTVGDSRYISSDSLEKEEEWARYNMARKGTQNFNLFSMPDIFGATRALFHKRRTQAPLITAGIDDDSLIGIHIQVSDHMSHFWTTFARFGDPNGQRSAETNNGYVMKDDPSNDQAPPFWPSVLGALPYMPPDIYYSHSAEHGDIKSGGSGSVSDSESNYNWKPRKDRQFKQMIQQWNSTRRERSSVSNSPSSKNERADASREKNNDMNDQVSKTSLGNGGAIIEKPSSGEKEVDSFQPPFKKFLGLFPKLFVEYPDGDEDEDATEEDSGPVTSVTSSHRDTVNRPRLLQVNFDWIGFRNGGVQIDLRRLFQPHGDDDADSEDLDDRREGRGRVNNGTVGNDDVIPAHLNDKESSTGSVRDRSVAEAIDITFNGDLPEVTQRPPHPSSIAYGALPNQPVLTANRVARTTLPGVEVGEEVHVMVFDEATGSSLIGDDCVCKFWNNLQYRF